MTATPSPPGTFAGVLVFYIDAQQLASKFTQEIKSGKTGYAWIMDNQGLFLTHPERDFIGKNAFTVRKARMPAISFDAINEIQREKMLTGKEGWGTYISGWHRGLWGIAGEIQKLIAYAPVKLADPNFVKTATPAPILVSGGGGPGQRSGRRGAQPLHAPVHHAGDHRPGGPLRHHRHAELPL